MNRSVTLSVLGLVALVVLLAWLSGVPAQRFGAPEVRNSRPGRYQAIDVGRAQIILLDTQTGDLYRATADDIRPYRERPQPGDNLVPVAPPVEQKRSTVDKDGLKEKVEDKKEEPVKDKK